MQFNTRLAPCRLANYGDIRRVRVFQLPSATVRGRSHALTTLHSAAAMPTTSPIIPQVRITRTGPSPIHVQDHVAQQAVGFT